MTRMWRQLVLAGLFFGLVSGAAMVGVVALAGGTIQQALIIGIPLSIGGAVAFPVILKSYIGDDGSIDSEKERLARELWRTSLPVVLVGLIALVGLFLLEGFPKLASAVVAGGATFFIYRRLSSTEKKLHDPDPPTDLV
jgi:uncharacterized oligopeptide transporter (OPT) family protein